MIGGALAFVFFLGAPVAKCASDDADCAQGQAITAMKAADWATAVVWWERAYAARPDSAFVFNLGSTYDQWGGHCRDALQAFSRYFTVCPPEADCAQLAAAKKRHLKIDRKCHGTLKVATTPEGAMVAIGDEEPGPSPVEVRVVEGTYRVVAQLEGRPRIEQAVEVKGGGPTTVMLRFPEAEPPPAAVVAPPPGAVVTAPPVAPPESRFGAWTWVALGVGGAGVVVGGIFTATSVAAIDEEARARESNVPDDDEVFELRDDATRDAALAHVGYGVGLAGLTVGLVMWLLEGTTGEANAWRPTGSPGQVILQKRF